ncbi:hypothetical protein N0B44_29040 [Roseibacterium beibuensis]|uniref:hypothetical protein n=1 Tax=[Roseibacterium] beibuensis TaxID=1193142 RepID=UPI00217DA42B|nr:hypothetical protein [Roseibacterium beibuensis]MCS6626970.1 hypothetical protein [Roseibacterium beibuensis]
MRTALLTAALLALAACGRDEGAAPAAPTEAPPIPSKPPLVEPPQAPDRLGFVDGGGVERLSLSCSAGQIEVAVPGFERIGSEDRLTVGAGDEAFAFAADLQAPGEGIVAGGAAEADLLARLARGETVSAVYGRQTVGPLRAARPASLPAFATGCTAAPAG